MLTDKLNLMVNNSNKIDNVAGTFGMNIFKKCNALTLTLKNKDIDINRVNECRYIIKNYTSLLSNFRGNNLLTTAVNLSLEDNPTNSFHELMDIYSKLKSHFFTNQFLVLAAQVIFNARDHINVNEAIVNTRKTYDHMKSNHVFLTSSEDISAAAMIATTSTDLNRTFADIESCYSILKNNGFWGGNNLQSLSHILSLFEGTPEEKCSRVISLDRSLRKYNVPLKGYSLPILGVSAFATDDFDVLAKHMLETNNYLKKHSGFGSFSLGTQVRSMISSAIVTSSYIEANDVKINDKFIEATNNAALNIIIVMQIAASSAAAGAAAGAAASSGS